VTFGVGPTYPHAASTSNTRRGPIDYPDTYDSPFQYINGSRTMRSYGGNPANDESFCLRCAFRPWADTGAPETAEVTYLDADGTSRTVLASWDAGAQRFTARLPVDAASARIEPGAVHDEYGETNGTASTVLPLGR
jgi:hypothetical protein